ncbi:hypothetical protein JTB14_019169 [Gonioctena quinquepunctata]|nr:hypothetical protein JTB14_019169 [Gonioctena quinquepunctata]
MVEPDGFANSSNSTKEMSSRSVSIEADGLGFNANGFFEEEEETLVSLGENGEYYKLLPRIQVELGGKLVNALVDTGASVNFIRPDLLVGRDLTGLPNPAIVHLGCTNLTSPSLGHLNVPITIANQEIVVKTTVLSNLNEQLILGMPFFLQTQAVLDISNNCVYFGTEKRSVVTWENILTNIENDHPTISILQEDVEGEKDEGLSSSEDDDGEEISEMRIEIFDTCDMWECLLPNVTVKGNVGTKEIPGGELNQMVTLYEKIIQAQETSECIIRFKDRLERARQAQEPTDYEQRISTEFLIENGILYFVGSDQTLRRVVVPKPLFFQVNAYARKILKKYRMSECNAVTTPCEGMSSKDHEEALLDDEVPYRQAVGIMYLMATHISYAVSVVAESLEKPSVTNWKAVKRILKYLKGTLDYGLLYRAEFKFKELEAYCDADGCDLKTRRSRTGIVCKYSAGG